jgi:nucleoid-associated protein YgaU
VRVGAFRCGVALALFVVFAAAAGAESVHEVQPGETLWQIAAQFTGDPHQWPELYRANRDQIKDPSRLYPGQVLSIPDFDGAGSQTEAVPTRTVPQHD